MDINPKGGNVGDNGNKLNENNDRLKVIETRIKELEPKKNDPDFRKELSELYNEKIKLTTKPGEPKDFKIAEIWIKDDQIALDAVPNFWSDKLRALGIFDYCKDIVKDYNPQPKISLVNKNGFKNFVNNLKRSF